VTVPQSAPLAIRDEQENGEGRNCFGFAQRRSSFLRSPVLFLDQRRSVTVEADDSDR
jgi:hypothetical protein